MKKRNQEIDELREERTSGTRQSHFLSYIICVLAAIVLWLVIMNVTDDKLPGSAANPGNDAVADITLSI